MTSKEKRAQSPQQAAPAVAIPLPHGKKVAVQAGCICMMLSVAMYGLVFATLTTPILTSVNALEYVSLFSIFAGLGLSIMTPIGGKLGDLIGRRNIVVIPGLICAAAGIAFAFVRSLWPLMFLRLLIGFAQGAFTAAPYITVGLINERRDVPKAMGMLATAIAVGGFGGAMIAGILTDMGLLQVAVLMPAVPLLAGVALIGVNLPNIKRQGKVTIDVPGIVCLVVTLTGILLALNFGSTMGWTHPAIILGFVIGIAALVALVKVESRSAEPIIPMYLFKNSKYTTLLIVGFICYFYQTAMNVYGPIGATQVIGAPYSVAGALQMPRTLVTIFLPTAVGIWVGKKTRNVWKAMALATLLTLIPMAVMGFTSPGMSVVVYFVALAITGVAESFRSVSITPAAQDSLTPQDMGVGTALVNFFNSLSGTVAAAVFGVAYNLNISANPSDPALIQSGVNAVFVLAAAISGVGLAIVLARVRPAFSGKEE